MRLFTAIDIPKDLKIKLNDFVADLRDWKRASARQLHITLLFLGECTDDERKKISNLLRSVSFKSFELTVDGFGVFPNRNDPRILWAGINKTGALMELQSNISETLQGYGSDTDFPDYIPHITLARRKNGRGRDRNIEELIEKKGVQSSFRANCFILKRSVLLPEGSHHETIETFSASKSADQKP